MDERGEIWQDVGVLQLFTGLNVLLEFDKYFKVGIAFK